MMIPLLDRRSACLLLPYTQSLLLSLVQPRTTLPPPPPQLGPPLPLVKDVPTATLAKTSTVSANLPADIPAETETEIVASIEILARFITNYTPREVLEAVRDSGGRFLYRGEEPNDDISCFYERAMRFSRNENHSDRPHLLLRVCDPPPDLLLPETYGYDPSALDYFKRLEGFLSSVSRTLVSEATATVAIAKPSNAHIVTSDPSEAGKWGRVVSIWPLKPVENKKDSNINNEKIDSKSTAHQRAFFFSYVWPSNRSVFYTAEENKGRNHPTSDFQVLVKNQRLREALEAKDGREVLFAFPSANAGSFSSAAFVAIPVELDEALRKELERIDYGL